MKNYKRYLARIVIEATSPLTIGSGQKGLLTDRLIARDSNDLPYIPGTSLAGITRHALKVSINDEALTDQLFGFHEEGNSHGGQGSRIIFSQGYLISGEDYRVMEGRQTVDFSKGFFSNYRKLPVRDHVRISAKGSAMKHGKYDEELVYKGSRFCFEIELEGRDEDQEAWELIMKVLHNPLTRIGSGSRKGFGQFKVITCKEIYFDLRNKNELYSFLNHSASLNSNIDHWKNYNSESKQENSNWVHYRVTLTPDNFYLFGSGTVDQEADTGPKTETIIIWENKTGEISKQMYLIPASSIKGALAHRVAFHYNRISGNSIESEIEKGNINKTNLDKEKIAEDFKALFSKDFSKTDSADPSWNQHKEMLDSLNIDEWINNNEDYQIFHNSTTAEIKRIKNSGGYTEKENKAVKELFGITGDRGKRGQRGHILLSDIYIDKKEAGTKTFDHVSIDRFTGGGRHGALYNEIVINTRSFTMDLFVEKVSIEDPEIKQALEKSLQDLVEGRLQLGGNVNRGHGAFSGSYEQIKN